MKRIYNIFLQILEDGFITDRLGKKINFTNTIIIFTSNVGVKEINEFSNTVGFPLSSNADQEEINKDKTVIDKEIATASKKTTKEKAETTKDNKGRRRCKTCGKFMGNK